MQIGVIGLGGRSGNISRRSHIEPKDHEARPS
jgi:hypothetical protein